MTTATKNATLYGVYGWKVIAGRHEGRFEIIAPNGRTHHHIGSLETAVAALYAAYDKWTDRGAAWLNA